MDVLLLTFLKQALLLLIFEFSSTFVTDGALDRKRTRMHAPVFKPDTSTMQHAPSHSFVRPLDDGPTLDRALFFSRILALQLSLGLWGANFDVR